MGHDSSEEGCTKSSPNTTEIVKLACFRLAWSFRKDCCNFKGLHSALSLESTFLVFDLAVYSPMPHPHWDNVKMYLKEPCFLIALFLSTCYPLPGTAGSHQLSYWVNFHSSSKSQLKHWNKYILFSTWSTFLPPFSGYFLLENHGALTSACIDQTLHWSDEV